MKKYNIMYCFYSDTPKNTTIKAKSEKEAIAKLNEQCLKDAESFGYTPKYSLPFVLDIY